VSNTQPRKIVEQIGARIQTARDRAGMTVYKLAKQISIAHPKSIRHWEAGDACPNAVNIVRLCVALDVSADWLLGIKD